MGEGGVDFRLQEGEEEVQEVDSEGVADCDHWGVMMLESLFVFFPPGLQGVAAVGGDGSRGWMEGSDGPMYHPCATTMRTKKRARRTTVLIHR